MGKIAELARLNQGIIKVKQKLKLLPCGHPDIGHLATLLIGLTAERNDIVKRRVNNDKKSVHSKSQRSSSVSHFGSQ